jgi:putative two-component system response regulator
VLGSIAKILLVDDEEANRELLARLLRLSGYAISHAPDGDAAFAAIAADPPDVILIDANLAGVDGYTICRTLKSNLATRLIPVVLLTAVDDRRQRIQGIRAGADDFLGMPIDTEELRSRVRSLVRLKRYTDELDSADSVITSLVLTVEARDAYTKGHCWRLAQYATALGRAIGLDAEQVGALERGGYLHDVGKIGIPDALLLKPGPLTDEEFAVMKQHTLIGERLCGHMRSLALVRPIVRHHHERRDGSGYPDGLSGDAIPLLAEIVAIADTFDAVTTDRPYRKGRPAAVGYEELALEAARERWRPELVEAFVALGRADELVPVRALNGAPPPRGDGR